MSCRISLLGRCKQKEVNRYTLLCGHAVHLSSQKQTSKSLADLFAAINALYITRLSSYLWLHQHMYTFMYLVLTAVINMYACMGCLYDGPTKLVSTLIGLDIAPLFNKPFLAESASSFWGRRWNLCVGNSLRELVYDPIQEGTVRSTLCNRCGTSA